MWKTDPFWRYAKEAILSAYEAKTDEDKEGLLELARTNANGDAARLLVQGRCS
jgi:hypothetical protein